MSLDDDLRDALRVRADESSPEPREWANVPARAAQLRQTRRRTQGALALVAAAVIVVVGLVVVEPFGGDGRHRSIVANPPTEKTAAPTSTVPEVTTTAPVVATADLPSAIVAITEQGELVELDPADGARRRVIKTFEFPLTSVAVTPDGSTLYVEGEIEDQHCPSSGGPWNVAVSVDRATGVATELGVRRAPTVSPDGRRLAFIVPCPESNGIASAAVVVEDLTGPVGEVRSRVVIPIAGLDASAWLAGPLSFAPDSVHLLGHVVTDGVTDAWIIDTSLAATTGEQLEHAGDLVQPIEATIVPVAPPGPLSGRLVGERYLGDTGLLGVAGFCDVSNVFSLDPLTGVAAGQGIVFGTNGVTPGEESWSLVDSDRGGRNLLIVVRHDDATTHLERVVSRDPVARFGTPRIRLADDVVSAAWVPEPGDHALAAQLPSPLMAVRIRDTLLRETVELETREPGKVSMYVCGPTVYDAPHIGNARTAVVFDAIRRYLAWTGLDVTYVANVTDVEDKIIRRASEQGRTEPDLAAEYEAVYFSQMAQLNVLEPDQRPHATEYIDHMIELIGELVDADHAYAVGGHGVYFAVERFPGYGALPHRTLQDLRESAGARVEIDEAKRSPMDFALWKAAKAGEPAWDSPWGKGRPGWHIECSAMSLDLLGEGFDLHGGGSDLLFPHHENERAQANAAGHEFARHWLHSGMVTIGGEKMAKSAGNFLMLRDALATYDARAIRLSMLQTHYARAVDLGPTELDGAAAALARLDALVRRAGQVGVDADAGVPDERVIDEFRTAMDDDFNTPRAIAAIFDANNRANRAIDAHDNEQAAALLATVVMLAGVLGIDVGVSATTDGDIDALVRERDEAREARDFARADEIRAELTARGINLEDGPRGTTWHR